MNGMYLINEIFTSIDGEGLRAGELANFIRLTGCNLRCTYCDTRYAFAGGWAMSREEILEQLNPAVKNVTITGGEPLLQDCTKLIEALLSNGYKVNIETNGSVDIAPYLINGVMLTVDYKCMTSGMNRSMLQENFEKLRETDVIKFVVGSVKDMVQAEMVCDKIKTKAKIYISPVHGSIEPKEIVEYMLERGRADWRVQLQLHKYIWEPNKRGV